MKGEKIRHERTFPKREPLRGGVADGMGDSEEGGLAAGEDMGAALVRT